MDNVLAESVIEHDSLMMNNVLLTGIAGQTIADNSFVKNCIYLAQHGADKVAKSETQPGPWFDHYAGMFWSMDWALAETCRVHQAAVFGQFETDLVERGTSLPLERSNSSGWSSTWKAGE